MNWKKIKGLDEVASPALLVDADRIQRNIAEMVAMVGGEGVGRLRPHVKTHKMAEVVKLQLAAGISKFKVATLAEAKMVAMAGAREVLLALQPVGPTVGRLGKLIARFPETTFSAVVDDVRVAERLDEEIGDGGQPVSLWIDVDCGMHRTGIPLGDGMEGLRKRIGELAGVKFGGLHVYDGHINDPLIARREASVKPVLAKVQEYLEKGGVPATVVGGSPTFGIWSRETGWECSPGTTLLWDAGYARAFPELEFEIAAALHTRVISKPGVDLLCLDLGHKAVAAENPLDRRVFFPELNSITVVMQSEEHLVLKTDSADDYAPGDSLIGYPQHICPTVALHAEATVVRGGSVSDERWRVAARDR